MTQRSVETVIGRLVSDEELRETFRRDRHEAIRRMQAQGLELNRIEIFAIEALDPAELDRLAAALDPRLQKASLKRRRRATGWLLAATLLAGSRAAVAADPLTLDEAIRTALGANRELKDASLQLERDDEAVADAKTKRLPTMELQALAGQTLSDVKVVVPGGSLGSYPGTGPIPSTDTTITSDATRSAFIVGTIAQPLTQLHAAGLNVRLNRTAKAIDQEELRARRAAVVADVKGAYYGILRTETALTAAEEQLAFLEEAKRVADDLVARESVLPADAVEAKAHVAAQQLQIQTLRDDAATLRERLNDLLGRPIDSEVAVVPVGELALTEEELAGARQRAVENRPELKQALLRVEQSDTQRRLVRAEAIPDVSLAVSYLSYFGIDLLPTNVAQAGLQLKWQPFDWGRGKRVASAALRTEQARNDVQSLQSRIALDVGRAFRALGRAQAELGVRKLAREAAIEKARVATNREREQAALHDEALRARADEAEADARYQQAVLDFWSARADFEKAIGEEI